MWLQFNTMGTQQFGFAPLQTFGAIRMVGIYSPAVGSWPIQVCAE